MKKVSEVHEHLYHYTTWSGLLGILETQSLWATHYKFLNDYSEIVHFRNELISLMSPYVREIYEELLRKKPGSAEGINNIGGIEQVVQHDTGVFVDAQYDATGDEIYLASFCGQNPDPLINVNGLLSQWRGYGVGGGLAIVFNSAKLEELLGQEVRNCNYRMIHLSDVVYSEGEQKMMEEFEDDLQVLAQDVKLLANVRHDSNKDEIFHGFFSFVHCITRYKHYGFREENEVRIVALPATLDEEYLRRKVLAGDSVPPEKPRKYRIQKEETVPYIELFESANVELPIEKIIVGPHVNKEKRASALRAMLRNSTIEVRCSDIPFIG